MKNFELKNLKKGAHIHLIGVGGIAMGSLAGLLKKKGFFVTGSDQNVYPPMLEELKRLQIPIKEGYQAENLNPPPDFVIVGNVAQKTFPEIQFLLNSPIPYTSLPKALQELVIRDNHSIVVVGTHGKTSVTSLMIWIAKNCHLQPGFLVGGFPKNKNISSSFAWPKDPWFIIEGDEYDTAFFDKTPKFIHYRARSLIFNNLEFDHADIYPSLKEIKKAFSSLLLSIPKDGLIVANAQDENAIKLMSNIPCQNLFTYGLNKGDYQIKDRSWGKKNRFTILRFGKEVCDIRLKHFGLYNALNALSAFALAYELGWPERKIKKAIWSFEGVKNRQEILLKEGEVMVKGTNGKEDRFSPITLIKDFAHHPTSVQVTLEGAKERFCQKRIIAIFEPRSFSSRHKVFQDKYIQAFSSSSLAIIAAPYRSSEIPEEKRLSHKELSQEISKTGVKSVSKENVKDVLLFLKKEIKRGDVVIVMSNGSFQNLTERLILMIKS